MTPTIALPLVCVLFGDSAAPATRQPSKPVVVLVTHKDRSWPAMDRRTTAELRLLGLRVVPVQSHATSLESDMDELVELARRYRAISALSIVRIPSQARVEILIQDRLTDKLTVKRVSLTRMQTPHEAGKLALLVVEQLRASLVELRLRNAPPAQHPVPKTVERIVESSLPASTTSRYFSRPREKLKRMVLRIGLGASLGWNHLQSGSLELAFGYQALAYLRVETDLTGSVLPKLLQADQGTARVGWLSLRGLLFFEPWNHWPARPGLLVGAGMLWLWSVGDANVGYQGRSDGAVSFAGLFGVRLSITLTQNMDLLVQAVAAIPVPRIDVRFADRTEAGTGPIVLDALAALDFHF